jgi:hypothetical protein
MLIPLLIGVAIGAAFSKFWLSVWNGAVTFVKSKFGGTPPSA